MALTVLPLDRPLWDRVFTVAPLIIVGTRHADGTYDLAPKHMAMPVGWQNYYGFVCSPRHATYHNARRALLPTRQGTVVDGPLVEGVYLHLECRLHGVFDGFGENSLLVGRIVAAAAEDASLRAAERDEAEQIHEHPLLMYISPGRYAEIRATAAFPFPRGFSR